MCASYREKIPRFAKQATGFAKTSVVVEVAGERLRAEPGCDGELHRLCSKFFGRRRFF